MRRMFSPRQSVIFLPISWVYRQLKRFTRTPHDLRLGGYRARGAGGYSTERGLDRVQHGMSGLDIALCAEERSLNRSHLATLCTRRARAEVVVAIPRMIPVALGGTQIRRIVVPRAPTDHAIGARTAIIPTLVCQGLVLAIVAILWIWGKKPSSNPEIASQGAES